ncbi:hypothetical protein AB0J51_16105 [Micromonospora echinofusca]|uniref:hypothetical protein n=1 Tax=Micromonospora echinofusca TaxID=47858 RepID=UPI003438B39A
MVVERLFDWAFTNDTGFPPMFTVPPGGSVVRETLGGYDVQVLVGGVVVASASVTRDAVTACGTEAANFNLIVDCRPSPYQVTLRIKNATEQARPYRLVKQRGEELTGTALPGNTFITEDWVKPTDRWKLEIAGYGYVRLVNEPPLCNAPPTATPSSTPSPSAPTSPSPVPTTPAPATTRPPAPDPTTTTTDPVLDPVAHSSELGSGDGLVIGGLAGLLVGSALGLAAAFRLRRRTP